MNDHLTEPVTHLRIVMMFSTFGNIARQHDKRYL